MDSSLSAENLTDSFYQQGNTGNAFIKSGIHNNSDYNGNLISYRPGSNQSKVVFYDWLNNNSSSVLK